MSAFPLAYHITFGTYGTRLHGDDRGTVDRDHNIPLTPFLPPLPKREMFEHDQCAGEPIILTHEQRLFIEATIPQICERGGWQYHVAAGGPDHVHTVLSAEVDGKQVRRWLKQWLSEALSERWPLGPGRVWWAEGGSVKWKWDQESFDMALNYVRLQRAGETAI
ncbi:MAG: hypothetical protein NTW19_08870 [Planctomycetota bacterium]|nr:hypothetical protein [Planctomycetota bacterium]